MIDKKDEDEILTGFFENSIQVLHQHRDIHLAGESEDEETTELLREGIKKLKTSIRDRTRGTTAAKETGDTKSEASVAPQIEVEDRDKD